MGLARCGQTRPPCVVEQAIRQQIPNSHSNLCSALDFRLRRMPEQTLQNAENDGTKNSVETVAKSKPVQTEDFLGQHHVPLAVIDEADLDREAPLFEAASPRKPR